MQVAYVIFWWFILEVIGLISFPLVSRLFGGLPDRGYSISKPVGLLLLTYIVWIISSFHIMPFGGGSLAVSFLLLAVFLLYFGRKNLNIREWPRKQILISEAVFAGFFILFLLITMGSPDIYYQGAVDAFFNSAFLNSTLRADYFPPVDPWFAGESLPYYYGGHLMVATLIKMTAVPPSIAFNIAVSLFPALAACAAYGIGYNITRRKLYGFITAFFICIIGFASGAFELAAYLLDRPVLGFTNWWSQDLGDWFLRFNVGEAAWMMEGSMVNYPYDCFLRGDLHTYLMSTPFQVMYITFIFALFQQGRSRAEIPRADTLLQILLLGVSLGFFMFLNSWEYPTYIIFTVLAFIILQIRTGVRGALKLPASISHRLASLPLKATRNAEDGEVTVPTGTISVPIAIIALSFILFIPYYVMGWMSGFHGIGIVEASLRTKTVQLLEFGSLFLFAVFTLLMVSSRRISFISVLFIPVLFILMFRQSEWTVFIAALAMLTLLIPLVIFSRARLFRGRFTIPAAILVLLITVLVTIVLDRTDKGFQVLIIVIPLGLFPLFYIFRARRRTKRDFVFFLVAMGAALIFFCELFYIKDAYAGGLFARNNTVMKVYLQLWVFLAIPAAYAVYYVMRNLGRKRKVTWVIILLVLVAASMLHPIATTTTMIAGDEPFTAWGVNSGTLDGIAYIKDENRAEYEAIEWLNEEIKGQPVILEAPGGVYTYSSRVSTFTGLPTLLGWTTWEWQWRSQHSAGEFGKREKAIATIYNTVDNELALELLEEWNVKYVYIGTLERHGLKKHNGELVRAGYDSEGLAKFAAHPESYKPVFENEEVAIYEVTGIGEES